MSTPHTATVYIQNNTGGTAYIQMSHMYSDKSLQSGAWTVAPGEKGGPMTVDFETGFGTGLDYWYCSASVIDGPKPGIYVTEGSLNNPQKECELEGGDANSTFTNTVDTSTFHMNQPSGGCSTGMTRTGPYSPITNVFVLMLENRSFDHVFGFSGIPGINTLKGDETNSYNGTTYTVGQPAVDPMTTDPNHEFLDTMAQLCGTQYGPNADNPFATGGTGKYPTIDNSGFVANYATIADEDTGLPSASDFGDVMTGASSAQVSAMVQLAQEFAVCDRWYSSIPGPTWPNRLFAMAATSSGLDATPASKDIFKWETVDGFDLVKGSLFQHIANGKMQYRLYNDSDNQFASNPAPFYEGGGFAIMSALKGIFMTDVRSFEHFAADLQGAYPYQFTFIEPNYGNALKDTYKGGSSQHAMDSLAAGEAMIAATYNAIRSSPLWPTSLLIITYDEHGGFYDHDDTPRPATPPGDGNPYGYNKFGFDFATYGVRVPTVIVSPLITGPTVDSTLYDHTSIAKTVEELYGLSTLTDRDASATSVLGLLNFDAPASTDRLPSIEAAPDQSRFVAPPVDVAADMSDPTPLPDAGNEIGFLHIAAKTDIELQGGTDEAKTAVLARLQTIQTKGQARQYFQEVGTKLQAAKTD